MSSDAPRMLRDEVVAVLAVVLAAGDERDVGDRLPVREPDAARRERDRVDVAVAHVVRAGVGQARELRGDAAGRELGDRVSPLEREAVRTAVAVAADEQLAVRVGREQRAGAALDARPERAGALRDVEVGRVDVELAVADQAAVDRHARRDRVVDLHRAGEPAEGVGLLDAEARDRHRPEDRQREVRLRDAGVDVAVVAEAGLEPAGDARAVLRFARGQRLEVAVDARAHVGGRIGRAHLLELPPRRDVVAGVEVGARELEPRAHVVREAQHVAFEREHAFAREAAIDRGDAAPEIGVGDRVADQRRAGGPGLVRATRLDHAADLGQVGRRRDLRARARDQRGEREDRGNRPAGVHECHYGKYRAGSASDHSTQATAARPRVRAARGRS